MFHELQAETRLDIWLYFLLNKQISRNKAQQLIKLGIVSTDEGHVLNKPNFKSKHTIKVKLVFPHTIKKDQPKSKSPIPDIPVLFENQDFAIIHKPQGLSIHPNQNFEETTVVDFLKKRFATLSRGFTPNRPGIVHRLDKETEGVLLITKTNDAQEAFAKLFKERRIYKSYVCYHWGILQYQNQLIKGYIQRNSGQRTKMLFSSKATSSFSKESALVLDTLKTHSILSKAQIQLLTGRKHQIRAVLAALNKPVIGDSLYGHHKKIIQNVLKQQSQSHFSFYKQIENERMLLFAKKIAFVDPIEHVEHNFDIPSFTRLEKFEQKLTQFNI